MAGRLKRRVEAEICEEEENTPTGKRSRPATAPTSAGRKSRKSSPPVFIVDPEEDQTIMPTSNNDSARSPKPPSAEEFKAMLREGLANVAKKEQLDVMMTQVKGNAEALRSLEQKVDSNCLLYTSPSPRDRQKSRMPSSA